MTFVFPLYKPLVSTNVTVFIVPVGSVTLAVTVAFVIFWPFE
ncbi:MAG: hypothetical protein V1859_10885 [archaeon]